MNKKVKKDKAKKKKFFEVTVVAFKRFYIEAEERDDVLHGMALEEEMQNPSGGNFDWEVNEADVKDAEYMRETILRHPEEIAKEENYE